MSRDRRTRPLLALNSTDIALIWTHRLPVLRSRTLDPIKTATTRTRGRISRTEAVISIVNKGEVPVVGVNSPPNRTTLMPTTDEVLDNSIKIIEIGRAHV